MAVNPISTRGGGAHYTRPVLRAPPDFQTLRRPCGYTNIVKEKRPNRACSCSKLENSNNLRPFISSRTIVANCTWNIKEFDFMSKAIVFSFIVILFQLRFFLSNEPLIRNGKLFCFDFTILLQFFIIIILLQYSF